MSETTYVLNDKGIAFWVDGVLAFDCPMERMAAEPYTGVRALMLLENIWVDRLKNEAGILAENVLKELKGGEKS